MKYVLMDKETKNYCFVNSYYVYLYKLLMLRLKTGIFIVNTTRKHTYILHNALCI